MDLQVATSFGGPSPLATALIADVLAGGSYRKHMAELRVRLACERDRAAERLARLGIVPWIMPRGGFYLWCRLPSELDLAEVARRCMDAGVVLAPGNVFSVSQSAKSFLRFNVAQMAGERTYDAIHTAITASHIVPAGGL